MIICYDPDQDNFVKIEGGLQEAFRLFRENTGHLLEATVQRTRGLSRSLNQSLENIKRDRANGVDSAEAADPRQSAEPNGSHSDQAPYNEENIATTEEIYKGAEVEDVTTEENAERK
ncbi:MAG: hypothetical protein ACYDEQ_07525 [Desulfocucumaceae bacterium]